MRTRTRGLALALIIVAASCGDDDDGTDTTAGGTATTAAGTSTTPGTTGTTTTGGSATSAPSGSTAPPTSAPETANCDATLAGTELRFGTYLTAEKIDPTLASGGLVGGHELAAVYDVLFRFDFETNSFVPQLAESLTPNDDFSVWTLTLRDGVTYSDGTPLTAQLVSDNIDRFFEEGVTNASGGFLAPITEKKVVDETTLEFTLSGPWAEFPFVLSDEPGMIVNTGVIGDDIEAFAAQPPDSAGLGPYIVERNAPGEELVMVAREDYWGGPVCIERLVFRNIPGSAPTYEAFQNDELDVAFLRDPATIAAAEENGEESFFVQQDSGVTLMINHGEGRPGSDPRVREAIWLALDAEAVNQRAYQGQLSTGKSFIQEGSRFYSDAIETVPNDPEEAARLVEEAKADGWDGTLQVLCNTSPPAPDTALTAEGLLEAAGIDVTVETPTQPEQIGMVVQGEYDTACWGYNAGPETAFTTVLRSFRSDSAGNRQGYQSDEMDAAIVDFLAADGEEAQQAAMAEVNNIYVRDHVTASIGAVGEGTVWNPSIQGLKTTTSTITLFDDAYFADGG